MASIPILNRTGEEVGSYEIDPAELAPKISKQLLHDVVVMYEANRRQGSAQTKGRGEIAGSTKKLYRQKGTGNARAGNKRTNIRRGGGVAFAKKARDFGYQMPRKAVRAATRMALASRIADQEITLIDDLRFEAPKTKEAAAILKALQLAETRILVAIVGYDLNVYRSLRNIEGVEVLPVSDLNALAILKPRRVLMTTAALDAFRAKAAAQLRTGAGGAVEETSMAVAQEGPSDTPAESGAETPSPSGEE